MKKTVLLGVVLSLTTCLTGSALAATKTLDSAHRPYYVRADVGGSIPTKKLNNNKDEYSKKHKASVVFGAGAGYRISDNFRTELNIAHRNNFKYSNTVAVDTNKQKISSTTAMINGFYDIVNYHGFTPYLTAGLGMAHNNVGDYANLQASGDSIVFKGKKHNNFAWNVGTGVMYKISNNFAVDLGYKYVDFGKVNTSINEVHNTSGGITTTAGDGIKGKLKAHEVSLGLVYNI